MRKKIIIISVVGLILISSVIFITFKSKDNFKSYYLSMASSNHNLIRNLGIYVLDQDNEKLYFHIRVSDVSGRILKLELYNNDFLVTSTTGNDITISDYDIFSKYLNDLKLKIIYENGTTDEGKIDKIEYREYQKYTLGEKKMAKLMQKLKNVALEKFSFDENNFAIEDAGCYYFGDIDFLTCSTTVGDLRYQYAYYYDVNNVICDVFKDSEVINSFTYAGDYVCIKGDCQNKEEVLEEFNKIIKNALK